MNYFLHILLFFIVQITCPSIYEKDNKIIFDRVI